jgi:hypothetical protein
MDAEIAGLDVSQEVEDAAALEEETDLLLALGAGLNVPLGGAVGVDLGYRYGRIFVTDGPAVHTNAVYAALHLSIR